eukprot:2246077-Pyramimonas_sp.AAC.1
MTCPGAMWPAERRFENAELGSPICPRCGGQEETLCHQLWECPCTSGTEALRDEGNLAGQARVGAQPFPRFWLRGPALHFMGHGGCGVAHACRKKSTIFEGD